MKKDRAMNIDNEDSPPASKLEDRLSVRTSHLLERSDVMIYAVIGASFLIGALVVVVYSFFDFWSRIAETLRPHATGTIATAVIQFVSDLLLALIIMEVLSTVTHYLKSHATSLRPFLFIGIISATRSILSIGARLSVGTDPKDAAAFQQDMIELGVSAAVVLALGITLKLLGREIDEANP